MPSRSLNFRFRLPDDPDHLLRRLPDVRSGKYRRDHGRAVRSGLHHRREIRVIDAADGEYRDRNRLPYEGEVSGPLRSTGYLCRRIKDGPEPDIVGPGLFRRPGLNEVVGRDTDDPVSAQKPSRRLDRQIVLPEMHTVGACRCRNIRVIVQDEQRVRPSGRGCKQPCRLVNRPSRTALVPVLEQPDPGGQRADQRRFRSGAEKVPIKDQAKTFELTPAD